MNAIKTAFIAAAKAKLNQQTKEYTMNDDLNVMNTDEENNAIVQTEQTSTEENSILDEIESQDIPTTDDLSANEINDRIKAIELEMHTNNGKEKKLRDYAEVLKDEITIKKDFDLDDEVQILQAKVKQCMKEITNLHISNREHGATIANLQNHLRMRSAKVQLTEEQQRGQEMVKHFSFPFNMEDNPRMFCKFIGSLASSLQNDLIYGEEYLNRLRQKVYKRRLENGDSSSPMFSNPEDDPANDNDELQIERIEEERSDMRAMMFALSTLYQAASAYKDPMASYWPPFLYRTDEEVRKNVQENAAKRRQEYIEQQRRLNEEGTGFHKTMDKLTMPSFNSEGALRKSG
jgi:hypothetical protein